MIQRSLLTIRDARQHYADWRIEMQDCRPVDRRGRIPILTFSERLSGSESCLTMLADHSGKEPPALE